MNRETQRPKITLCFKLFVGTLAAVALNVPLKAQCTVGQDACCMYLVQETITCPTGSCSFSVCDGGYQYGAENASSECVVCGCGIFESYYFTGGTCYLASLAKPIRPAEYQPPLYAYVRGCDGNYALTEISAGG